MQPESTVTKDPSEQLVYEWDWSAWLLNGASIASQQFDVTVTHGVEPSGTPTLIFDSVAPIVGTPTQKYAVRIKGGTVGLTYRFTHQIVTDESPAQTAARSISVFIANR